MYLIIGYSMETDFFKIPHNKHLGKKPKDWYVPKHSKEKQNEKAGLFNVRKE